MSGKLFVGGISWETTEETLKTAYQEFGEVSDVIVMRERATNRHRGFGFVTFADPEVAKKVSGQKINIDGREVETKLSVPREQINPEPFKHSNSDQPTAGVKLFLGGIAPFCTEETLRDYFTKYGEVQEIVIMKDRETGVARGFGFCTFVRPHSAAAVLDDSKTHEIDGKMVEIKPAESRESISKGKGGGKGGYGFDGMNPMHGAIGGPMRGYGGSHMGSPGYGYGAPQASYAPPAYGYNQGYQSYPAQPVYGGAPVYAGQPHAGYGPTPDSWNAGYGAEQIPPPPDVPPPPFTGQTQYALPAMTQDGQYGVPPPPGQHGQGGHSSRFDRAHPYAR